MPGATLRLRFSTLISADSAPASAANSAADSAEQSGQSGTQRSWLRPDSLASMRGGGSERRQGKAQLPPAVASFEWLQSYEHMGAGPAARGPAKERAPCALPASGHNREGALLFERDALPPLAGQALRCLRARRAAPATQWKWMRCGRMKWFPSARTRG